MSSGSAEWPTPKRQQNRQQAPEAEVSGAPAEAAAAAPVVAFPPAPPSARLATVAAQPAGPWLQQGHRPPISIVEAFGQLSEAPPGMLECLVAAGIADLQDVAGFTRAELVEVLCSPAPASTLTDVEQRVLDQLHGLATEHWKRTLRARAAEQTLRHVLPGPAASSKRPRRALPLPPSRRGRRAAAEEPGTPQAQTVKIAVSRVLTAITVTAGSASTYAAEFEAAERGGQLTKWMEAFAATIASRYEIGSLRAACNVWARWNAWVELQPPGTVDPLRPEALALRQFLVERGAGGRTAASGAASSFAWLRRAIGLHGLPLDSPIMEQFKGCEPGHTVQQRRALSLKAFQHLKVIASAGDSCVSLVAGLLLRGIVSGLRHAHFARTVPVPERSSHRMLAFHVSRGKSRNGEPFYIALPTHVAPDEPLILQVSVRLAQVLGPQYAAAVFMPDIHAGREGLSGACTLSARSMSYARYVWVLRAYLMLPPLRLDPQEAGQVTSYASRRFLPTAAELIGLSTEERASLGNWADSSSATGRAPREPMAVRYSDVRLEASCAVKRVVLAAVHYLLKLEPDATHARMSAMERHRQKLRNIVEEPRWGQHGEPGGEQPAIALGDLMDPPVETALLDPPGSGGSGTSTSSSDTSSSGEETTPAGGPASPTEAVAWIATPRPTGRLHLVAMEGDLISRTACNGRTLTEGYVSGASLSAAGDTGRTWCAGCLARAGPARAAAIIEAARRHVPELD